MIAELVLDAPMSSRARRYLENLAAIAPKWARVVTRPSGDPRTDALIVYGMGNPARSDYIRRARTNGARLVCWDLAYWDREDSLRLSLDGPHPKAHHLALSADLEPRRQASLRDDSDPDGFVLLIGLGPKSVKALGLEPKQWEAQALAMIRERWPGVRVVWRPKVAGDDFDRLPTIAGGPIETALLGARAVVMRHSNVAIDACEAGIPVYCEDGAGYILYKDNPLPTPEERRAFLNALSWWEWNKSEPRRVWAWIEHVLKNTKAAG